MKITIEIDEKELKGLFKQDEKEEQSKNEKIENHVFSDYAKIFGEGNVYWSGSYVRHRYLLNQMENIANDMLCSRGYLFLNNVYDMLGFTKTKAGETVGWVYDEKNPIGDNCVIFDIVEFGNGLLAIDFNVDGVIAGTKYVK